MHCRLVGRGNNREEYNGRFEGINRHRLPALSAQDSQVEFGIRINNEG